MSIRILLVWSNNASSFAASEKRNFFNEDEFIEGSGQDDATQILIHKKQTTPLRNTCLVHDGLGFVGTPHRQFPLLA